MKKKILNNVVGFGHNIHNLSKIIKDNPNCNGFHHVRNLIQINENTYKLPYEEYPDMNNCISIVPLKQRIIGGFY
jgi:hypothetical protein